MGDLVKSGIRASMRGITDRRPCHVRHRTPAAAVSRSRIPHHVARPLARLDTMVAKKTDKRDAKAQRELSNVLSSGMERDLNFIEEALRAKPDLVPRVAGLLRDNILEKALQNMSSASTPPSTAKKGGLSSDAKTFGAFRPPSLRKALSSLNDDCDFDTIKDKEQLTNLLCFALNVTPGTSVGEFDSWSAFEKAVLRRYTAMGSRLARISSPQDLQEAGYFKRVGATVTLCKHGGSSSKLEALDIPLPESMLAKAMFESADIKFYCTEWGPRTRPWKLALPLRSVARSTRLPRRARLLLSVVVSRQGMVAFLLCRLVEACASLAQQGDSIGERCRAARFAMTLCA